MRSEPHAVSVAAATAIAGGSLIPIDGTEVAQAAIGVTGGVAAGAIGTAQLLIDSTIQLRHERSALRDVWALPAQPVVLAPTVYAFLRQPFPAEKGKSRRDRLVNHWQAVDWLGKDAADRAHLVDLFFGGGGVYSEDELLTRQHMVAEVKGAVSGMHGALRGLSDEVRRKLPSTKLQWPAPSDAGAVDPTGSGLDPRHVDSILAVDTGD